MPEGAQADLLPYLEQQSLYNSISTAKSPSDRFEDLAQTGFGALRCPSDITPTHNPLRSGCANSNYSGIFGAQPLPRLVPGRLGLDTPGAAPAPASSDGMFCPNQFLSLSDVPDGMSFTLLFSEMCMRSGAGIWTGVVRNSFGGGEGLESSVGSPGGCDEDAEGGLPWAGGAA